MRDEEFHRAKTQHPGRGGRPLDYYLAYVRAYLRHVEADSPAPNKTAAQELGVTTKQFTNALYQARLRGLLPKVGKGKVGGQLTPKARALMDAPNGQGEWSIHG